MLLLMEATTCKQCAKEFVPKQRAQSTFCSRPCWYAWKHDNTDPRYVDAQGYVSLRVPLGTPGRYENGRLKEHRYVMQTKLGRPLRADENVHHINGDKQDNRIENLELWAKHQPKMQRGHCPTCTCGST